MDKKHVHTLRMPIRWGDMDAMGHVNNTVYFRYIEQARVAWLEAAGFLLENVKQGPVVINAHCTFLKQLKYPGEIEIRTFIGAPGRSSFETMQEIRRVDQPDVLCAEGGAKVVWIDYAEEKSVPLPEELRRLLSV
ncbi:MAG: acyl-CoA thioesterase [Burkholderiales bacterium]|nr:acyl-CoA thioesterase [Burkholderiales bacterium]